MTKYGLVFLIREIRYVSKREPPAISIKASEIYMKWKQAPTKGRLQGSFPMKRFIINAGLTT